MMKNGNEYKIHALYVFLVSVTIIFTSSFVVNAVYKFYKQKNTTTFFYDHKNDLNVYENSNKSLKDIIRNSQSGIMTIEVHTIDNTYYGSGFLYNDKGDVVTNAHVISEASKIIVKLTDGTEYVGSVIGMSSSIDIALIRVEELVGKTPLNMELFHIGEVGDEVIALGSPLGLENTVTTGIISGIKRSFEIEEYNYKQVYQISAPISPGSSGGPLLHRYTGKVIGINSAKIPQETIGFSIPIIYVLPILENWSNHPYGLPSSTVPKYKK